MTDSKTNRTLPSRASLTQLRKQAKELLKAYREHDPDAVSEVARFEQHADSTKFTLVDAQRVLARAYGFASWTKLKQRLDGLTLQALMAAAESGDLVTIERIAQARPELLNVEGEGLGGTALHRAVLQRNEELTRLLMQLGADPHQGIWPHREATSALQLAKDRECNELVTIVQEAEETQRRQHHGGGAEGNSQTDALLTAILLGRTEDAMRMLAGDASLITASGSHGATPLHLAAWKHNSELVAWLLERQAPADSVNPFADRAFAYSATAGLGATPLDYATIVAGWSAHKNYFGWSPDNDRFPYLENAAVDPRRFEETVALLRSHGAVLTPRAAVAVGDQQAVREMHHQGQLENNVHLVRGGLLAVAVRVNRPEMVALLLELGNDPDEPFRDHDGETTSHGFPLWFASMCGRYEMAERLLAHGADVNAVVAASGDALGGALATRDEKMQKLLIRNGARLTVENLAGDQARDHARAILEGTLAAQSLNVENATPTQLAEQLLWTFAGRDPEIVRDCLPYIQRRLDDPWWATVLINAMIPESLQALLEHGVDPNVAGANKATMLHHIATDYGTTADGSEAARVELARLLLDAGGLLRLRDSWLQSTPLAWACRWGRVELAQFYLERGANPQEVDAEPWSTPLAWARRAGHQELVQRLS